MRPAYRELQEAHAEFREKIEEANAVVKSRQLGFPGDVAFSEGLEPAYEKLCKIHRAYVRVGHEPTR